MIFINPKPIKFILLTVCFLSLFNLDSVWSNKGTEKQKYHCKVISKSQAIYNAKSRIKGKIVAANLVQSGKRSVYKVRVLVDNKRVKTITIPACQ